MDKLDLSRIEPKHFRWQSEVTAGGSLLLHRPGTSALHRGPDGLSRNVEGRDRLVLARDSDWPHYRQRIRGISAAIQSGEADDAEAEARTVEQVEKEDPKALTPLPYAQGLAVSLKAERGSRERQFQPAARGEKAKCKAKAKGKGGSESIVRFQRAAAELPEEFSFF